MIGIVLFVAVWLTVGPVAAQGLSAQALKSLTPANPWTDTTQIPVCQQVGGCGITGTPLQQGTALQIYNYMQSKTPQASLTLSPLGPNIDDAPQIRAAILSNTNVSFTAGSYNLCSTQPSPYPSGFGPAAVLVQSKSNFTINFGAAQFKVCNGISGSPTGLAYFFFDKDTNFIVNDGTFVGNMTGKTGSSLTAGIDYTNNVGFAFNNQSFVGDWQSLGGGGEAFGGDYNVNGTVLGTIANNVAICFDVAFQLNVSFIAFNCSGMFHGSFGSIGFSNIYDIPNLGINSTGYTINDSSNIAIFGNATNFSTGWGLFSGNGYTIDGFYTSNTGGSLQSAWGGIIGYNNGGSSSSIGHPPSEIIVRGHYNTNGNNTVTGGGILIESNNITNSDTIMSLHIDITCNNNINVCVTASSRSHLSDISGKVDCLGSNQTSCLDPNVSSVINPSSIVASSSPVSLMNNTTTQITSLTLPAGVWEVSGMYGIVTSVGSSSSSGAIWNLSATFPSAAGTPGYVILPITEGAQTTSLSLGTATFNLSASTPVYLNVSCSFSSGTCAGFGSLKAARQ